MDSLRWGSLRDQGRRLRWSSLYFSFIGEHNVMIRQGDIERGRVWNLSHGSCWGLGGSFAHCSFCQLSPFMFWTLLEHGGIKVVQRTFISFYCRVPSTTAYVCKKALFLFWQSKILSKDSCWLKTLFVSFLLLEMCAISTEDAYTRLAAEDTCKFHTPSKHENALYDAFNDKKSEKGRTIVFKWQI